MDELFYVSGCMDFLIGGCVIICQWMFERLPVDVWMNCFMSVDVWMNCFTSVDVWIFLSVDV